MYPNATKARNTQQFPDWGGDEQKLSVRLKKRAKNEDRISPTADPIWTKQSLKALRMTLIGEKLQSLLKAR